MATNRPKFTYNKLTKIIKEAFVVDAFTHQVKEDMARRMNITVEELSSQLAWISIEQCDRETQARALTGT